jgi:CheY-like chemotaxis protein
MPTAKGKKTIHMLVVEDNKADLWLLQLGLKDVEMPYSLQVASDGEIASEILQGQGDFTNSPLPDLVILDLHLPKKNGIQVLTEMRQNPILKCIPVIVLTSSGSESDVKAAYESGANAYMRKPTGLDETLAMAKQIENYWMRCAVLPSHSGR